MSPISADMEADLGPTIGGLEPVYYAARPLPRPDAPLIARGGAFLLGVIIGIGAVVTIAGVTAAILIASAIF